MKKLFILFIAVLLAGCGNNNQKDFEKAMNSISPDVFARHLITLSSDEFQGRKPMTPGEEKTVNYIKSEFEKMGLDPAFGNSYFQDVPLVEIVSDPSDLIIETRKGSLNFRNVENFVAFTKRMVEKTSVDNAELVFMGYGVIAPEYHWNDYENMDVKGKVVVVLINDPGFGSGDTSLFKGKAMTYYGRWTYKFEEAARQGAAGCIIVHEDIAAAYPWSVVTSTRSKGSNIQLQAANKHMDACAIESWITRSTAEGLFSRCGLDYELIKQKACRRGFKAIPMNAKLTLKLKNTLHLGVSKNVSAILKGTDRSDECIVYSAHWDHFGIGKAIDGDSIYHGASDNASGIAEVLEIARAFKNLKNKPLRSILFLIPTAEESGLLGAEFYVKNPAFPLEKTIADINFDGISFWGRMKDVTLISLGESELDHYVAKAAQKQDRYIMADPLPENGNFFRADHFWFARAGVPIIYGKGLYNHRTKGKEYAMQKQKEYILQHYHKPSDRYIPGIHDLSGAVEDTKLFFDVGYSLSNESSFPKWYPSSAYERKIN